MKQALVDKKVEQFSDLCNWLWFNVVNPAWPQDGFSHTSDECRALANEIFELLHIDLPNFDDLTQGETTEEKANSRLRLAEYWARR